MSNWAIIPVKPPPGRKSRLVNALDACMRDALVIRMARHVVQVAVRTPAIDVTALLGSADEDIADIALLLPDPGLGLNGGAASAFAEAARRGASRVTFIAGDLPLLSTQDLDELARQTPDTIAIAPDRHGTGTNGLSLPLPACADFVFAYGPGSFARHCAEVARLGLRLAVIRREGLARDVDEPADLADAAALVDAAQ